MNSEVDLKIGSNYKITVNKKLGSGAFGEIYHGIEASNLGVNLKTSEHVAVKMVFIVVLII